MFVTGDAKSGNTLRGVATVTFCRLLHPLLPANIVILFAVDVTKVKCIYCCKILLQL